MQHPRLCVQQVQALARSRDGDVRQSPLFFQAVALDERLLVRKETFLEAGQEDGVELQALRRVHRHHLQRILALAGLVLAGFERGVR
ncbi:hypothetical protein D3C83_64700 [compost metagenome]